MARWAFLATFVVAWAALDQLVTSPPNVASALISLGAALAVLVVGELVFGHGSVRSLPLRLGFGRPAPRAIVAATVVGGAVVVTYLAGATLLDIPVELRSNWPMVLVAAMLFHGLAEELVWRGFVFGHLRRSADFWPAVVRLVPLIALTHVPIILGNGLGLGVLAVMSAAVTCLPFAYLWERGRHTIWGPTILHGLVGAWQCFERGFPDSFSVVILLASIVVPLSVFAFGDRFFGGPIATDDTATTRAPAPSSARGR